MSERDLAHQEESDLIQPERCHKIRGVHHVAHRLRHFLTINQQEPMPKNTFGQLKTGRPEESRPIDRVESSNILTDQVQISGPIFREQFPVRIGVAKPGQVVG